MGGRRPGSLLGVFIVTVVYVVGTEKPRRGASRMAERMLGVMGGCAFLCLWKVVPISQLNSIGIRKLSARP